MSQAASQAAAFHRQAVENEVVSTVRDEAGSPAPKNSQGRRAQPFWSARTRVERIIKTVPAYSGFAVTVLDVPAEIIERCCHMETVSAPRAGRASVRQPDDARSLGGLDESRAPRPGGGRARSALRCSRRVVASGLVATPPKATLTS